MKILALDTSTTSGSIALVSDGSLVAELNVGHAGAHAKWLLKSISDMLDEVGMTVREVDLFAFAHGPGSFTGLRIGTSVVKGLAWSTGKGVAGVSTLEALAMNLQRSGSLVCPVLDARRGEVYSGLYSFDGPVAVSVIADSAAPPEEFLKTVSDAAVESPVVFLGPGLSAYGDKVRKAFPDAEFAPENLWLLRAANVALIAGARPGSAVAPALVAPLYLRRSTAEVKLGDGPRR
jgi:tRNA threonylcarbamoyladenosine biosynthesis protein TsaB